MQVLVRTKENTEKKLTLTYEEMEAEREEVLGSISWKISNMFDCFVLSHMVMCLASDSIYYFVIFPESRTCHASILQI
jgi:hypothetical protein